MAKQHYKPEQIISKLREAEVELGRGMAVGLPEPEAVCIAPKSISVCGRAPPYLRRRWTKTKPKGNINPSFGLTHALAQSKWSGHIRSEAVQGCIWWQVTFSAMTDCRFIIYN